VKREKKKNAVDLSFACLAAALPLALGLAQALLLPLE
jgi:hypothetical protein